MDQPNAPAYRLIRRPPAAAGSAGPVAGPGAAPAAGPGAAPGAGPAAGGAPRLDQAQQQVVDHAGGPLLVLAGPGTGKTTTIVATVADRIENRGISPERILVLTFSRKAAAELRERITARLRRTTREPLAVTFHSYAYALARREFVLAGDEPPRLLSAPEQLLEVRRLLKGESSDGGSRWPERLR
ncbi:MAG TPA: UvrD-helicase domain-containing protein, partial [Streptosporangiaceae bacterium]